MYHFFKITLLGCMLTFMGCEPNSMSAADQQRHLICKSLIQGFLDTQQLAHYQITQNAANQTTAQRHYVAQPNTTQALMPQQQKLSFLCTQQAQQIAVSLIDPTAGQTQMILTLNLPPASHMKRLTAYALAQD